MNFIQAYHEDTAGRKVIARSAKCMGNRVHCGRVVFPMDIIDRRKNPAYRSSRVRRYTLADLQAQQI